MSMLPEQKTNSKTCSHCGEDKPLSDFHNDKSSKDGLTYNCKKCIKEIFYEFRQQKPERVIYYGMVKRSKKKGWDMPEWTPEDIRVKIEGCCEVTGLPFNLDFTPSDHHCEKSAFKPSPDRIDNSKGYTKDNVRWVVFIFNMMRASFPDEDIKVFVENLCKNEVNL
jgi:hypothetical protein